MKKKGFTLIELLAVIVILAIIALILVPVISSVIESARMAAARTSAQGYIDAVKNRISLAILDKNPLSGTNTVSDLESEVEYKGTRIEKGIVTINDDILTEAKLCVNDYSFIYRNEKIDNSDIDYCVDKSNIEISILGNTSTRELRNQYSYDVDLSSYDITSATNMVCNNNAIPSINENTLHIDNIYGDTKCSIESSIATTFNNLDSTTTNVIVLNDETITTRLNVFAGRNVVFDLNGKTVSIDTIQIRGTILALNSQNSGKIVSTSNTFNMSDTSKLTIRNITIESTDNGIWISSSCRDCIADVYNADITATRRGVGIHSDSVNSVVNIYGNTSVDSSHYAIENNGSNNVINVYGGTYISAEESSIRNSASATNSYINITQTDTPIYVTTLAQMWKPAINNNSTGTINITANQANACTNNASDTTSGLCAYAEGVRPDPANVNTGNGAVRNGSTGTINIDGGTYFGWHQGVNNNSTGTINIKNANIGSNYIAVLNNSSNGTGKIYIENSTVTAEYAVSNRNSGEINVKSGLYNATKLAIDNAAAGNTNITGGTFISSISNAILNNSTGAINITQTDTPIYATSLAESFKPVIINSSTGTINITANRANACTNNASDTTSGLCAYGFATGNGAVRNVVEGIININGGTYYGNEQGAHNGGTGTINIRNATVVCQKSAIYNHNAGTYNICDSTLNSIASKDISNSSTGTVNYNNVIFSNGTTTPDSSKISGTITPKSACSISQ